MNDSVSWSVVRSEGDKIPIKFQRDGAVQTVEVEPYHAETRGWRRKSVRQLLILPAQTALIEKVEPNTPAAGVGLRPGDKVVGFDQTPMFNPLALMDHITKNPEASIVLHVERAGAPLDLTVKPALLPTGAEKKPRIGIQWADQMTLAHPTPVEQIRNSVKQHAQYDRRCGFAKIGHQAPALERSRRHRHVFIISCSKASTGGVSHSGSA